MRLREVEAAYGERLRLRWRAFPLIPDRRPGRRTTAATAEGRRRAGADEPRAGFAVPPPGVPLPESSLPALTAVKCAERQGPEAFRRLHARLFAAHFRELLDIGRPEVLRALAGDCGLDLARYDRDWAGEATWEDVLRDYAEGAAWFGVSVVPTVVFAEKLSLVGAVPAERYHAIVDWLLAGAPGGVVPLPAAPARATAPGQA